MTKRWCKAWGAVAIAAVGVWSAPTQAMVTLQTQFTAFTCGITSAAGTVYGSCDSPSFAATVNAGETAFLTASLSYHYTDDGLPLDRPTAFQLDPNGFRMLPVAFEAAVLYPISNNCSGSRYCNPPPHLELGGTGFAPLVLGLNDHPDDLTGTWDLSVSIGVRPDAPFGASVDLFVGATPVTVSAPIPEPASVGLMGVGLLASMAFLSRRRRAPPLRPELQPC